MSLMSLQLILRKGGFQPLKLNQSWGSSVRAGFAEWLRWKVDEACLFQESPMDYELVSELGRPYHVACRLLWALQLVSHSCGSSRLRSPRPLGGEQYMLAVSCTSCLCTVRTHAQPCILAHTTFSSSYHPWLTTLLSLLFTLGPVGTISWDTC